jgi:hypothetical protein
MQATAPSTEYCAVARKRCGRPACRRPDPPQAGYWETRVGTVHDFRVTLIDNDTRILFTIVFDGDFKPYITDILREASPWLDQIFLGVWDGFRGTQDRKSVEELLGFAFECDLFFVSNPDVTARNMAKMQRLSGAVSELLDAAT